MPPHFPLQSPRLGLRPWRESDAPALYRLASDPRVGTAAGWPPHTSVEMSREVIRSIFSTPETYAIVLRPAGEPAGCIGLVPRGGEHRPGLGPAEREVGYWLGAEHWGRGLAPEALDCFAGWCRTTLGLGRLWIVAYPENLRSQRVALKCGFRPAGDTYGADGPTGRCFALDL